MESGVVIAIGMFAEFSNFFWKRFNSFRIGFYPFVFGRMKLDTVLSKSVEVDA